MDKARGQALGHLNLNLAGVCLTEVTSLLWASFLLWSRLGLFILCPWRLSLARGDRAQPLPWIHIFIYFLNTWALPWGWGVGIEGERNLRPFLL